MVDKIIILNATEAQVIFTHRPPVKISVDKGEDINKFLDWFFGDYYTESYDQFVWASDALNEDTQKIELETKR